MYAPQKCRAAGEQPAAQADKQMKQLKPNHIIPQKAASCQVFCLIAVPQLFDPALSRALDLALAGLETAPDQAAAAFWKEHRRWLEQRVPHKEVAR